MRLVEQEREREGGRSFGSSVLLFMIIGKVARKDVTRVYSVQWMR